MEFLIVSRQERVNNMARFGFRGGRRSGGFRSSGGGKRSGEPRRGASGSAGKNRGQRSHSNSKPKSSKSGVSVYSLYNSSGKRTYVGSTNNPNRRAAQHTNHGNLEKGGKMVVESKPMSRKSAEQLEAKKIQGYKRRTGKLPKHNRTGDGQYHHRKSD